MSGDENHDDAIAHARRLLQDSTRIVVLTGAGISTASGIPDFRGPDGVWTKNPGAERLATIDAYLSDPQIRQQAWATRRDSPAWTASPNPGHLALVDLERQGRLSLLITQNIDGLHLAAGSDPTRTIEIHGTLREVTCLVCGDRQPAEVVLARVDRGDGDPRCLVERENQVCGGILKSATISFGQSLVRDDIDRAEAAAASCDLFVAVGTSLGIYPAAGLLPRAARSGAPVIIVNAQPTPYDDLAAVILRGPISEVLPAIVA